MNILKKNKDNMQPTILIIILTYIIYEGSKTSRATYIYLNLCVNPATKTL